MGSSNAYYQSSRRPLQCYNYELYYDIPRLANDRTLYQCIAPTANFTRCRWDIASRDQERANALALRAEIVTDRSERDALLREYILLRCCTNWHRNKLGAGGPEVLELLVERYSSALLPALLPPSNLTYQPVVPQIEGSYNHFVPYPADPRESVRSMLLSHIPHNDTKPGFLYFFTEPSFAGYVKIGYTTDSVEARMVGRPSQPGWYRCYPNAVIEKQIAIAFPKRIEKLVHLQMAAHRAQIIRCRVCDGTHYEWFSVDPAYAAQVIDDWAEVVKAEELYDQNGWLTDRWRKRVEVLLWEGEITARALINALNLERVAAMDLERKRIREFEEEQRDRELEEQQRMREFEEQQRIREFEEEQISLLKEKVLERIEERLQELLERKTREFERKLRETENESIERTNERLTELKEQHMRDFERRVKENEREVTERMEKRFKEIKDTTKEISEITLGNGPREEQECKPIIKQEEISNEKQDGEPENEQEEKLEEKLKEGSEQEPEEAPEKAPEEAPEEVPEKTPEETTEERLEGTQGETHQNPELMYLTDFMTMLERTPAPNDPEKASIYVESVNTETQVEPLTSKTHVELVKTSIGIKPIEEESFAKVTITEIALPDDDTKGLKASVTMAECMIKVEG